MSAQPQRKQGRIPVALQAVFLASNRGKEVHKPPPEKAANKVFFRNWFFQKASNSFSRGKKSQIIQTHDVNTPETKKRPAMGKLDSNDNVRISTCLLVTVTIASIISRGVLPYLYDS